MSTDVRNFSIVAAPVALQAGDADEIFHISGEMPDGFWLHPALRVVVQREGSELVAEQPESHVHAFGESVTEAILSLRQSLVEHYQFLLGMGDKLAPRLARERDTLGTVLTHRDG